MSQSSVWGVSCLTKYGSAPLPHPCLSAMQSKPLWGEIYASSLVRRQEYSSETEWEVTKMPTQWLTWWWREKQSYLYIHHCSAPMCVPIPPPLLCQEKTQSLCYQTAVPHITPCCALLPRSVMEIRETNVPDWPGLVTYSPCAASRVHGQQTLSSVGSCSSCPGRAERWWDRCERELLLGPGRGETRVWAVGGWSSVADSVQCHHHWWIVTPSAGSRWCLQWPLVSCLQSRNLSPLAKTTRFCPLTAIASSVSPELVSDSSPQLSVCIPPQASFSTDSILCRLQTPVIELLGNINAEEKGRESLCRKSVLIHNS